MDCSAAVESIRTNTTGDIHAGVLLAHYVFPDEVAQWLVTDTCESLERPTMVVTEIVGSHDTVVQAVAEVAAVLLSMDSKHQVMCFGHLRGWKAHPMVFRSSSLSPKLGTSTEGLPP